MFKLTRRIPVALVAGALAVGAAGCGEDEEPIEGEGIEEVAPEEEVIEEEGALEEE